MLNKKKELFKYFNKRFNYNIDNFDLRENLKTKYEIIEGKQLSVGGLFKPMFETYSEYCKNIAGFCFIELNNALSKIKPRKLNDNDKKEYFDLISAKFGGILRSATQCLDEKIAAYGNMPVGASTGVKTNIISIINKGENYAKMKIDLAVSDYNLNPQNWLRLNFDKLIFLIIGFLFSYLPKLIEWMIKLFK